MSSGGSPWAPTHLVRATALVLVVPMDRGDGALGVSGQQQRVEVAMDHLHWQPAGRKRGKRMGLCQRGRSEAPSNAKSIYFFAIGWDSRHRGLLPTEKCVEDDLSTPN